MQYHRWWVALLLIASVLFTCQSAWAAVLAPVEGVCVGGEPRLLGPPGVELKLKAMGARVSCGASGELIVTHRTEAVQPVAGYIPVRSVRPIPPDFDGWVFVWINGHPLRIPLRDGGWEPDAYVVRTTMRTVMPIRFFTEAIGGEVDWDQRSQTVTLRHNERTVVLQVGKQVATVNGRETAIDQAPFIWLDRVLLPTRFLLEAFGARVTWDGANSSVYINLPGAQCQSALYCGEARGGEV